MPSLSHRVLLTVVKVMLTVVKVILADLLNASPAFYIHVVEKCQFVVMFHLFSVEMVAGQHQSHVSDSHS